MKTNAEIRLAINNSGFFTWEIAQKLDVHENTFYRWMRTEMTDEKKQMIIKAIDEVTEDE
ncbi:hypothetical protein [Halobacillus mangrovi]|uniref:Uncharacterized protein n=1 Tax=Halobacillus mangrovi TaxID=402384 RepID=A0A1W5ZZZ6_9BACI|nr:hypothetical protein [Halobacillus mangrovi]ARI78811.1 hypothetical protein HM131_19085 [Halobacillus mangrovi]